MYSTIAESSIMATQTTGDRVISALAQHHLKSHGPGKWRSNSPFRDGSNSHALSVIVKPDGEHGAWIDHVSGESGSLYELAARLGVDTPAAQADSKDKGSSKRAYGGLEDYATEHGVTADVFTSAGWKETTRDGRPALEFMTATGRRWRFLDGNKPPYKSDLGYTSCWYGLQRATQIQAERGGSLVLCNGEASTVVAQHYGVAACAITNSGERPLSPELLEQLRSTYQGAIVVALDNDRKGKESAPRLAQQLARAGFNATVVDLGGTNGFDLADFCHLYEEQAAAELDCRADTVARASRTWLDESELDQLEPPTFLYKQELVKNGVNVLVGESGGGKTFVALHYSGEVAREQLVMYIAGEDVYGIGLRRRTWRAFYNVAPGNFRTWPDPVNLSDNASIDDFILECRGMGLGLIAFDTLAACSSGANENDTSEMRDVMLNVHRIRKELSTTVLLIHHKGKTGATFRGSQTIKDFADMMIELTNENGLIELSCEKSKNAAPFETRYLRLVEHGESCVILPAENVTDRSAKVNPTERKVLEALHLDIFTTTGAKRTEIQSASGVGEKTLYRVLSDLKHRGLVNQSAKGDPYYISEAGKRELSQKEAHSSDQLSHSHANSHQLSRDTAPTLTHSHSPYKGERVRVESESSPESIVYKVKRISDTCWRVIDNTGATVSEHPTEAAATSACWDLWGNEED